MTYDGSNLILYQGGNIVATQPATGLITPSSGSGTLQIGASDFGENFTGMIDQVRVYNRALSQSEIQADINLAIGQSTGLVSVYGPGVKEVFGPGTKQVFSVP